MERRYFKAINFDLDTNKLKKYYPRYQQAYSDLLRFYKANGFLHRQGSGYVSKEKVSSADIVDLIGAFQKKFEWSGTCVKKIDVTNVGAQYDLTAFLVPDDEDGTFSV